MRKSKFVTRISESVAPPIYIVTCFIVFPLTNTPILIGTSFMSITLLSWWIIYNIFGENNFYDTTRNNMIVKNNGI